MCDNAICAALMLICGNNSNNNLQYYYYYVWYSLRRSQNGSPTMHHIQIICGVFACMRAKMYEAVSIRNGQWITWTAI